MGLLIGQGSKKEALLWYIAFSWTVETARLLRSLHQFKFGCLSPPCHNMTVLAKMLAWATQKWSLLAAIILRFLYQHATSFLSALCNIHILCWR